MYKATLNGTVFFDTTAGDESFCLTSALVEIQAGSAGAFTFTVPSTNIAYKTFHRLVDIVKVYRDDDVIFSGRVYSIQDTFNTCQIIVCEGLLAILADSIFRPETFDGDLHDLIDEILVSHNSQVDSEKQLTAGDITVANSEVYRDYQTYETSISRMQDLADSFGGYMFVREDSGTLYFDWLSTFTTACTQAIDFGTNILDLTQEINSNDICTVLIPLGAENDNGVRLTVKSVNNDKDYIEASAADIEQYGRIVKSHIWPDVTTASALLTKGQAFLTASLLTKVTINVTAVDLADAGYTVDSFAVGQKVSVTSVPHGINAMLVEVKAQSLNLLYPSANRLTLGTEQVGYVESRRTEDKSIERIIQSRVTKTMMQTAIDQATAQITGIDGGYIVINDSNNDGYPDELLILDTPSISTAVNVWRFNSAGWGFSSNGYNGPYTLAAIIGDGVNGGAIVAGSITGDRIAANTTFTQNLTATNLNITGGSVNIETATDTEDKIALSYGTQTMKMSPKSLKASESNLQMESQLNYNGVVCADTSVDPKVMRSWFGMSTNNGAKYGYARLLNDGGADMIILNGSNGRISAHSSGGGYGYVPIVEYLDVSGTTSQYGLISLGMYVKDDFFPIGFQMTSGHQYYLYPVAYMNQAKDNVYGIWYAAVEDLNGNRVTNTQISFRVIHLAL